MQVCRTGGVQGWVRDECHPRWGRGIRRSLRIRYISLNHQSRRVILNIPKRQTRIGCLENELLLSDRGNYCANRGEIGIFCL